MAGMYEKTSQILEHASELEIFSLVQKHSSIMVELTTYTTLHTNHQVLYTQTKYDSH